jgi:dihydroxy-acid dehydratase
MPEAGYLPIPKKLGSQGVKDMVRISDARMSGTAFGTIVLHITPEAAVGGPLALVETGDRIRLDVPARRIELLVDDAELARRRAALAAAPARSGPQRGYAKLFDATILQADEGCDFDFMTGTGTGES